MMSGKPMSPASCLARSRDRAVPLAGEAEFLPELAPHRVPLFGIGAPADAPGAVSIPVDRLEAEGKTMSEEEQAAFKQPILDKYCVGCHAGQANPQGKPGLDLRDAPAVVQPSEYADLTWPAKFTPSYRALVPLVRNLSLEPDRAVLTPCEFHADTTRLVQMLQKGHYNVELDAEAWDRLITWIDLNAPLHGTWTEAGASKEILARRMELRLLYDGVDYDPEEIVNPYVKSEEMSLPEPVERTIVALPGSMARSVTNDLSIFS